MSRDERRQAIVASATPLFIQKGASVTTAEIAAAAGIAEGTIFRAFPDKAALIHETLRVTLDPSDTCHALEKIDRAVSLEAQLTEAAELLASRFSRITALMEVLRALPDAHSGDSQQTRGLAVDSISRISASLTSLFARHQPALAIEPGKAAAAFRSLVFGRSHPILGPAEVLTVDEVVSVILSGVQQGEAG